MKNLGIVLSIVLFVIVLAQDDRHEELRKGYKENSRLTGELEYQKGYIQGWEDGRKPIQMDTLYISVFDTIIMQKQFLIKDNIGVEVLYIPNKAEMARFKND